MSQLIQAQIELDQAISNYYARNEDGGNYEERAVIAYRIARKYGLDPIETETLSF